MVIFAVTSFLNGPYGIGEFLGLFGIFRSGWKNWTYPSSPPLRCLRSGHMVDIAHSIPKCPRSQTIETQTEQCVGQVTQTHQLVADEKETKAFFPLALGPPVPNYDNKKNCIIFAQWWSRRGWGSALPQVLNKIFGAQVSKTKNISAKTSFFPIFDFTLRVIHLRKIA